MARVLGRSKGVEAARGGATTTLLAWVIYRSRNMSCLPISNLVNLIALGSNWRARRALLWFNWSLESFRRLFLFAF